jgi:dTDP-4-dehydrorhamnose reductase
VSNVYMLFGKDGLVGRALLSRLEDGNPPYRVFAFDRPKADISNKSHVSPLVKYIKPTVVFNCAGVNDAEMCQDAPSGAFAVNAVGPDVLARECAKIGAKLIHISAADVYDGKRTAPYSERCKPAPINVLGQSKLEGEKAIAAACDNHLIIRPGWAFHYEGENPLTDWIANADRRLKITVCGNYHGSPTYVPDLVDGVMDLVREDARGVFNVANGEAATWESFAQAVVELTKTRAKVQQASETMKQWYRAPVPAYSVLSTKKYSAATGKKMRTWVEALKECLFEMHRYRPG